MISAQRARVLGTAAAVAASVLGLGACGSSGAAEPAGGPVSVVASTNVYGDIARRIGGGEVTVTSFISDPAQDPHSFEAGARNRLAVAKAAVVIENGGGYDDFMGTLLKGAGSKAEVLDAVEISGKTAPAGEELNEHVWYDLGSVARLADRISAALAKASPEDAAVFSANAASFKTRLKALEGKVAALKAAHSGEAVAITEPVPGYLLEAAGLANETPEEFSEAIEEGDDVSPRVLRDTLALFADKKVKALVYNAQTSGPQTERVQRAAKDGGVPVVPVTETLPAGQDYLTWMDGTITALQKALS
ncbi:metal ABC transporter solute-binding protein, Zn/Mn family [Actinomadura madurae]|uniref:metal ABC transporter solute-binding protein, Zn/Mn family n=1 Tax=Actinomadura madurae TaxID=1993 RepID=UPI0020265531|nr:zinc ABC transporter substrate-binding protein [Actinomadura madurae]MCP9948547.1 zinc ABC transporter substrate-binding protein [Actinomadura madurae]MCP9977814.1 zinc ABC transporter substrate-binding protein [Actinomadura madurae]URM94197.1 zinc ABC transporter substrate-binding protein [Actinomadura madurae]